MTSKTSGLATDISVPRKHNVTLRDGTIVTSSSIAAGLASIILAEETENNHVDNVRVLKPGADNYGVLIVQDSIGASVKNSQIIGGASSGYAAVHIKAGALDYHIEGNHIGIDGARGDLDYINDINESAGGVIKNNTSLLKRPEVFDTFYGTSSVTAETVRKTYTVPGGSLQAEECLADCGLRECDRHERAEGYTDQDRRYLWQSCHADGDVCVR